MRARLKRTITHAHKHTPDLMHGHAHPHARMGCRTHPPLTAYAHTNTHARKAGIVRVQIARQGGVRTPVIEDGYVACACFYAGINRTLSAHEPPGLVVGPARVGIAVLDSGECHCAFVGCSMHR